MQHEPLELSHDQLDGYSFIIPLDAPLPIELQSATLMQGPLLKRLAPLAETETVGLVVIPLKGTELLALDRVWPQLVETKRVALLTGLPGAKYDVLMTQAQKHLGLRSVDWPAIVQHVAGAEREHQRTLDARPWNAPKHRGDNLAMAAHALTAPEGTEDEDSTGL